MDPNAALANIIEARDRMRDAIENGPEWSCEDAAQDMADAFDALNEWMSKGGFTPAAWTTALKAELKVQSDLKVGTVIPDLKILDSLELPEDSIVLSQYNTAWQNKGIHGWKAATDRVMVLGEALDFPVQVAWLPTK